VVLSPEYTREYVVSASVTKDRIGEPALFTVDGDANSPNGAVFVATTEREKVVDVPRADVGCEAVQPRDA
jgi:hypothetical protein